MLRCERGSVSAEYAVVLVLVSLGATLSIAALGAALLGIFHYQQAILVAPVP